MGILTKALREIVSIHAIWDKDIEAENTNENVRGSGLKTNLILVGLSTIISAIVFGVYYRTLQIGFLLDDFYHIDYLMRAFDGDNTELMKVIFGSWSGPTGLNSFRPLTTIGLLIDFVFGKLTLMVII